MIFTSSKPDQLANRIIGPPPELPPLSPLDNQPTKPAPPAPVSRTVFAQIEESAR